MCVRVCVCVCVCVRGHMYICMYVCMNVYMCGGCVLTCVGGLLTKFHGRGSAYNTKY